MGTHYKGTIKEISSLNVYIKLIRATDSIRNRINLLILDKGLTESQFTMLDALFHLGPLSQSELGKKLLKSGGNITMIVDNLEKKNLVKRERSESDRRIITIHITKRGIKLAQKLFPQILSALVAEINVLNESEQIELQRICKLLGLGKASD
jgi:MarR family 2-MHQ and catechol resistance regulon transcriptional repressor